MRESKLLKSTLASLNLFSIRHTLPKNGYFALNCHIQGLILMLQVLPVARVGSLFFKWLPLNLPEQLKSLKTKPIEYRFVALPCLSSLNM